jgi:hypothetical protein
MENSFDPTFRTHIPSHKMLPTKFGPLYMPTLKLGMKHRLEADFTRDQKEGHFTKSLNVSLSGTGERVWNNGEFIWSQVLRNIHPVLTWTMSSIFFVNFMGPFLPELLLPLCNGQEAMIFWVLNFCHFVKNKNKILSQTPFLNFVFGQ